jgi:hypothetical protein
MQSPSSEAKILRESHDRENAEHSLIKHDISRACDCPEGECSRRAEELIEALYYVSPSAYNAMILQLARIPNYTDLLDEISEATGPVELASTTSPTANVLNPTDTAQVRENNCPTQPPTETNSSSAELAIPTKPTNTISGSTSTKYARTNI